MAIQSRTPDRSWLSLLGYRLLPIDYSPFPPLLSPSESAIGRFPIFSSCYWCTLSFFQRQIFRTNPPKVSHAQIPEIRGTTRLAGSPRAFKRVLDLLEEPGLTLSPGFRNQLDRAALSVFQQRGEGFERVTVNELNGFLAIARGSAGEVRSCWS